jgi:hypothetical protein
MEVVVEIPAGKSKRGWNYKPAALQKIVGEVMANGSPGFLGHQKPEDVGNEFPTPVTHWVGAIWKNGKAYIRGVIDQSAVDLKRWIRAKTIKTVSIFGTPKLEQVKGEVQVVDYQLLSIDWTPLGRAGMPTRIVSVGEMDDFTGELDGSHEELREALQAAARQLLAPDNKSGYAWVRRVFDEHIIVEHEKDGDIKLYKIPYTVANDEVQLGEKEEVVKKEDYIPAGQSQGEINNKGGLNLKELIEKLKAMLASGEMTKAQFITALGEIGVHVLEVTGEMTTMQQDAATLGKVKEALKISGEMDVLAVAGDAGKALEAKHQADHDKLIDDVLKEKVAGEMAQGIVREMLNVPVTATKEQIAGEIGQILSRETVKQMFSKMHLDTPVPGSGQKPAGEGNGYTRTETTSI